MPRPSQGVVPTRSSLHHQATITPRPHQNRVKATLQREPNAVPYPSPYPCIHDRVKATLQ
ncbi:hypothetical protein PIB30_099908, partial [Stylosanthes scabra]|nr:hypothetical protein [Stylosanthes scabra]